MGNMAKGSFNYFLFFLLLSILIFTLSKFGFLEVPQSYFLKAATVVSSPFFSLSHVFAQFNQNGEEIKLKEENLNLQKKIVDQQKLINENKALHDQFQTINPKSLDLLPANVVGAPRFIPGLFLPENFIIDVGENDNVKAGNAVVLKDNLIGRVGKTTKFLSEVNLISNMSLKFAAKTQNGVLGVVKGEGNGDLLLDNVLLSDNLEVGQIILTFGDIKLDSTGFPPDIIVGKIVSIEKNPTDLFQRAKLKTFVDFARIFQVFVVKSLR